MARRQIKARSMRREAAHDFAMILNVIRVLISFMVKVKFCLWQNFARMMVVKRPRHGFAMIRALLGRHDGEAIIMVALRPRHCFVMIRAKLGRHPGGARMMVAKRPRHGFAMMWASPTRHPGGARMMVAKRPRHGFAMIK
jgi:hypothetical protein